MRLKANDTYIALCRLKYVPIIRGRIAPIKGTGRVLEKTSPNIPP